MKRNVLIVEDNKICMDALARIVHECNSAGAIFCAGTKEEAYKYALEETIDLFLVDIILDSSVQQDVSGIQFVEKLRQMEQYKYTPVIFITSLIDQQMNAFHKLHCFDYIEKPFENEVVCDKVMTALGMPLLRTKYDVNFTYRKDGVLYMLNTEQIICAEMIRRKLHVYTVDDEVDIPYKTVRDMLKELPREYFLQCNRGALVNRKYIEAVDRMNHYVRMRNGKQLEIGCKLGKSFYEELGYDD